MGGDGGGAIVTTEAPALTAINERLRNDYVEDCQRGVDKWNKTIRQAGVDFELKLPHRAFHREIGAFSGVQASPEGRIVDEGDWNSNEGLWLPSIEDKAYIDSLMGAVTEPGKFANWITPPGKGIYGQPLDFDYVRFN